MPYGQVDKLCKLVRRPAAPSDARQGDRRRAQAASRARRQSIVKRAFDIALKLEGCTGTPRPRRRHRDRDRPLSELVPMYRDPKSDMPVTSST